MDGGGSVIAVREGGIDSKANIKNSPSSGSEKRQQTDFSWCMKEREETAQKIYILMQVNLLQCQVQIFN